MTLMKNKKEESSRPIKKVNHKENLSSSVLFTFTPKMEYMFDMLIKGIVPRYVYERLPGSEKYYIAPMKCFCDIPLGKVKNHMERYGYFGIGLKKSFLQQYGVTPVIYIHKNSETYFGVKKMKGLKIEEAPFLPLLKRYYGDDYYFIEGENEPIRKRIHFYDEREWRYLPKNIKPESSKKFNKISEGIRFANKMNESITSSLLPLKIPADAIEYIIISKKKDLTQTINQLRQSFKRTEMELLLTKIIIAENILKDF